MIKKIKEAFIAKTKVVAGQAKDAAIELKNSIKNSWPSVPTTENLFRAVAAGDEPLVGLLLQKGKDHQKGTFNVNAQSADTGWTCLHLAALSNKPAIAALLLTNGSDPSVRDKMGRTALQLAEQNGGKSSLTAVLGGTVKAATKPKTSMDLIFNRPASTMTDEAYADLKNQHNLKGLKRLKALIY